jgi:hypothetical protein
LSGPPASRCGGQKGRSGMSFAFNTVKQPFFILAVKSKYFNPPGFKEKKRSFL